MIQYMKVKWNNTVYLTTDNFKEKMNLNDDNITLYIGTAKHGA